MYVPDATWLEHGPQRPRACGMGDATMSLSQLDQTANNPSWTGPTNSATIGNTSFNDGGPFSFVTTPAGGLLQSAYNVAPSQMCLLGADPTNPNCLSDVALAAASLAASGSKPAPAPAASLFSNPIAIGVGLLFVGLLFAGKR